MSGRDVPSPRAPVSWSTEAGKRALDVSGALLGLVMLSPVFAIAAERRALSSGVEGAAIAIASLPLRLVTASRLHGARMGRDGIARLEDAWVEP